MRTVRALKAITIAIWVFAIPFGIWVFTLDYDLALYERLADRDSYTIRTDGEVFRVDEDWGSSTYSHTFSTLMKAHDHIDARTAKYSHVVRDYTKEWKEVK